MIGHFPIFIYKLQINCNVEFEAEIMGEFEVELEKCIRIFRFFGIQQFSVSKMFQKRPPVRVGGQTIYTLVLIFLISISFVAVIPALKLKNDALKILGAQILYWLDYITILLAFVQPIFYLMYTISSTKIQMRIFELFYSVSLKFQYRLKIILKYSKFSRNFLKLSAIFAVSHLLMYLIFVKESNESIPWDSIPVVLSVIFCAFVDLTRKFIGFLLIFYAKLMNFYLKEIERELKRLANRELESNLLYEIVNENVLWRGCGSESFNKRLSTLKHIYLSIWKINLLIKESVGPMMSFYIFNKLAGIMVAFYKIFLHSVSTEIEVNVVHSSIYVVSTFCYLSFIVYNTESVLETVRNGFIMNFE